MIPNSYKKLEGDGEDATDNVRDEDHMENDDDYDGLFYFSDLVLCIV